MTSVRVYSDVSIRCGHTGACVVAVVSPEQVDSHLLDLSQYQDSVRAELAATLWGLKRYQVCERLVAYTDLDWLPSLVHQGRSVSYAKQTYDLVEEIKELVRWHGGISIRLVSPDVREYRICHSRSRQKAKALAQLSGSWQMRSAMDRGQAQPRSAESWTNYL